MYYEHIAATLPDAERGLAMARLRREVFKAIYRSLGGRDAKQMCRDAQLSRRVTRRILAGDGAITIDDFAAIMVAAGCEVQLNVVPVGAPRRDVLAKRAAAMKEKS